MRTKILIALALWVVLTNTQTLIRLPLTKSYFNATTVAGVEDDGFLADVQDLLDVVQLDKTDNTYYTAQINIGSGNQPFQVAVDTATPFIWVATHNLQSNTDNHFDCNTSNTCETENYLFPFGRENGETIRGAYVEETIQLGENQTVTQHIILFNHNVSFIDNPADGVLGLGLQATFADIPITVTPFIDNLASPGIIANRSFSIFLANDTVNAPANENDISAAEQSWLILGGFDPMLMTTADFNYYPLADDEEWRINIVHINFNGQQENVNGKVLFDSRAGSTMLSEETYNKVLDWAKEFDSTCDNLEIDERTTILCNCPSDTTTAPYLGFAFNEADLQIYNILTNQLFVPHNDRCILDVVKGDDDEDDWVLGHDFMINYYTLFDAQNKQIGIAPANHNQQTASSGEETPLPVEPDGGIGDTPLPVEPDGGTGGQ
jgi:hypothetical protein